MRKYFDFVGISENDEVLDVACGSGDFSVVYSKKSQACLWGDILDGMIENC